MSVSVQECVEIQINSRHVVHRKSRVLLVVLLFKFQHTLARSYIYIYIYIYNCYVRVIQYLQSHPL